MRIREAQEVIRRTYIERDAERGLARNFMSVSYTHLTQVAQQANSKDYKSLLQEWSLKSCAALPTYRVISAQGPPHRRVYQVEVEVCGEVCGKGEGRSKKEAEQAAAQQALSHITTQKKEQKNAHKRSAGGDTQNIY